MQNPEVVPGLPYYTILRTDGSPEYEVFDEDGELVCLLGNDFPVEHVRTVVNHGSAMYALGMDTGKHIQKRETLRVLGIRVGLLDEVDE